MTWFIKIFHLLIHLNCSYMEYLTVFLWTRSKIRAMFGLILDSYNYSDYNGWVVFFKTVSQFRYFLLITAKNDLKSTPN